MQLSNLFGVITAYATQTTTHAVNTAPQHSSFFSTPLLMFVLVAIIFYFLLIRPQQKRAKAQKMLIEKLAVGEEIVTVGGIVGKITDLNNPFIVIRVAKEVTITIRKSAIESILPKGSVNLK